MKLLPVFCRVLVSSDVLWIKGEHIPAAGASISKGRSSGSANILLPRHRFQVNPVAPAAHRAANG
jgi:hypothetical protein